MFGQRAKIGRYLQFIGDSKHVQNVKGPMHREMVHFQDHFIGDTLSADNWLATVTNATIAVNHAYPGGWALITTSAGQDNESCFLATPLAWEDDMKAICEARILSTDVSGVALYFGFSDATLEGTPDMPIDYADGTLAAAADNAVGFICDFDDSVNGINSIVAVGVNGTTLETAIDSAVDWEDGAIHILRVELNPDGDAVFFLDGKRIGFMPTALTSGTMLCIITGVANRDAGADTVYIDRVDGWQDEYIVL